MAMNQLSELSYVSTIADPFVCHKCPSAIVADAVNRSFESFSSSFMKIKCYLCESLPWLMNTRVFISHGRP